MKLTIQTNAAELIAKFPELTKQIKFATAVALTKTATKVKQALPDALDVTFDRPTPFTKQGTYLVKATRDNLVAEVGFKDIQSHYLHLQAEGGTQEPGPAGIRLPGNIQLNAFGNIPKGLITKLKEAAQNGTLAPAIVRRLGVKGSRRKGAAPIQLFYGIPQGKGWEKAPMGIWRRVPGVAGGPGKLIPVIVFSDKPSQYKERLDLEKIAEPIFRDNFDKEFEDALLNALATAK